MEENAKTIIYVAGDYVQSKHVEYEIGNVEQSGIGIQIINGKPTTSKQSSSSSRYKMPVLQSTTFLYRYWNKSTKPITQLYQYLLKAKWIAKPSYLYGLIRRAIEQELISVPSNGKIWQITESHFVDNNSRPFNDLHKQKESKTAIPTIEALLQILEPSA